MDGIHPLTMGDRGRLVIPIDIRRRANLEPGTPLILMETDGGIVILTRQQLRDLVRANLQGSDLVDQLVQERRAASAQKDLETADPRRRKIGRQ